MSPFALLSLRPPRVLHASRWLRWLLVWRVVHTVIALVAVLVVLGSEAIAGPARIAALTAGVTFVLLGVTSSIALTRGRHVGRTLSLAADYLTFVGAVVTLLQTNRVFVGLDALGATFSRGVPFLLLALLAWIIGGLVAGEGRPSPAAKVLRWITWLGVVAALIAVGILPGLGTFLARTARPLGLALLLVGTTSWYLAWRTFQRDVGNHLRASNRSQRTLDGLLFVSPNLLGFAVFFAGPLLFSLFVSLTEWDAFGDADFVGLGNYAKILALNVQFLGAGESATSALPGGYFEWFSLGSIVVGARDVMFWTSIRNIVVFTLFALPLSTIPALFLATLLNSKAPGIKVFRAIYFIPSIAGVVAVALIWRQLFSATTGWLNYLISRAVAFVNGLPLLPEVTDPRLQWLSDADIALFSLVIVFSWMFLGYNAVLFLAGLQGVDPTLHEAAMLDGANRWQRFRNVTLPTLKPTTFFVVASTGILTLQLFGENVVLFPTTTPIGAGPENSTLTPVVYLYDQGFRRFAFGYASAVAWVLFVLIFLFTLIQFRRQREDVGS
ncbi:carbohydrate ABC transporter permease [Nitriliruptor alkaliphilus]|uniref:carbohydrate ABC transporter permease n=1 Tax=Nitriliruptor alkaliphilus TaxID=427918 RepID=UPI0006981DE7|nr:sugar ABC transporter permease [Nitriliruptor alkaliphilus]